MLSGSLKKMESTCAPLLKKKKKYCDRNLPSKRCTINHFESYADKE